MNSVKLEIRSLGKGELGAMGRCLEGGAVREGSWYWVRDATVKDNQAENGRGLVVMFTWMFSKRQYHMPYVHLFNACGWECLSCQPHYLNLWFPSRATALAVRILDELTEELKKKRRPVSFVSFSGGTKACLYIIIQILQGKCEGFAGDVEKYRIVRECVAGYVFDSTPIDYVSRIGVRLIRRMLGNTIGDNVAVKFGLQTTAKTLDTIFSSQIQSQATQARNAFYVAVEMAPVLILCSRNDRLAPFETIEKFCTEVQEQGFGKVTLVCWEESDHVAHLRYHPKDYKEAVSRFLAEIQLHYSRRTGDRSMPANAVTGSLSTPQHKRQALSIKQTGYDSKQGAEFSHEEVEMNSSKSEKQQQLIPATTVKLNDVADMIVEDVYDLQHDCKDELINKRIILTFAPMRSKL